MRGYDFDAIRQRHPLAQVARRTGLYVPYGGRDTMICCPMPDHDDRTPSMILHPATGRYHCFGCGATGDVIQWVRSIYQVPLPQAVRMLEDPGPLPPPPPATITDRHHSPPPAWHARGAERPNPERSTTTNIKKALADAWEYYTGYFGG